LNCVRGGGEELIEGTALASAHPAALLHELCALASAGDAEDAEAHPRIGEPKAASLDPDKIAKFLDVIRNDWGFDIYRAVSEAKVRLSPASTATFRLKLGDIDIEREIARKDFEDWIAEDVARIKPTVGWLLESEGISAGEIDNVFLTGGSSSIPAVRRVFATRFGVERLADGDNFQSVAFGLALIGLEDDLYPWLAQGSHA
jgi:hypothetical chaperone protein